jgi:hypothetical protein
MRTVQSAMWAVLVSLLLIPSGAIGQSHVLYLSDDAAGGDWCDRIIDSAPAVRQIHIFASTAGAAGVSFAAPLPECLTGATYLSETCEFPVHIGDSQNGIVVGFGVCQTGNAIRILTIDCLMQGLTEDCCLYRVRPYPEGSFYIEFVDCDFNKADGLALPGLISPDLPSPWVGDPDPPNGADNRSLFTQLDCRAFRCDCSICALLLDLYFGTDPDPPLVAYDTGFPYDPGHLEPNTTYYWKIRAYGCGNFISPVWSFSTSSAVASESTTWGTIKALYVD